MPNVKAARTVALDVVERVLSTFAQAFLAAIIVTSPGQRVSWTDAAAIAAFAAAASLLTSGVTALTTLKVSNPYLDLLERALVTFLQTLVGLVAAAGTISALSFDWTTAVKLSLIAAGAALLKGLAGLANKDTLGASVFVPKALPAPMPPARSSAVV